MGFDLHLTISGEKEGKVCILGWRRGPQTSSSCRYHLLEFTPKIIEVEGKKKKRKKQSAANGFSRSPEG